MAELVVLDLPGGPDFVAALQRVWADGDAAFVLDGRLPKPDANRLLTALAPGAVIESDGERRSLSGGSPTHPGDALVVATSGTTGEPKGVVLTHDAIVASAHASNAALGVDPASDVWLACLPLSHIGGLAVVTRSLLTDTPVIVHDRFDAGAVTGAARGPAIGSKESGATLTSLVTRALRQVDSELFRSILIGGAAPPPDRPENVVATYGMTETGSGCIYERRPLDGVEIKIAANGEILLRGDMLLRCYRLRSETQAAPGDGVTETDPKDAEGWFGTGDLGAWGDDGLIEVHGRSDDVIISGGEKVWPSRVEPLLARQPGVGEVAIVGRPHPQWGHQVTAVVVAEADAAPALSQLREAVKAELPSWYAPIAIELVMELPKTALGKIKRASL